jgi:DNA (cytosine-5)-methyltransferase 1
MWRMKNLDLFSGIGGFALGLEWAGGYETVAFCEQDRKCRKVLKKHWPAVPQFIDIETLTYERLKKRGITQIDIITGGFPCQDISLVGKGAGIYGDRSGLWKEFARLIGEIRPRYAIVENVAALRGRGIDRVLRDLAAVRYDAEWYCIPASAVGAPHQRDRIWIIAYPSQNGLQRQPWTGKSKRENETSKGRQVAGGNCQKTTLSDPDKKRCNIGLASVSRNPSRNITCGSGGNGRAQDMANSHKFNDDTGRHGAGSLCRERSQPPEIQGSKREIRHLESVEGISGGLQKIYWKDSKPPVCGMANGFPGRVDRLKQLGNSIVPQIAEIIGKAIMEYEMCNK